MLHVTPRELAGMLGISLKTVDRWVASGALPQPVRGRGPKGEPGWRRWPVATLAAHFQGQGRPVPAAWAEGQAA